MTLTDVLPQVEQLSHADLIELQVMVAELLRAQDRIPSADEIAVVTERYTQFLERPDESIGADEIMAYLDDLIAR